MTNDCLACCVRGSLDAARLATEDSDKQLAIVRTIMEKLATLDLDSPPPLFARFIHQTVEKHTGVADPYKRLKDKYNDYALSLFPDLEKKAADAPFETAVRLAIAGNIIDFGAHNSVGKQKVLRTIEESLVKPVNGDVTVFEAACEQAGSILWLGDNTGEIVFDKLLLQRLDREKVLYAVRGGAAQNDATLEDAVYTGVADMVRVIDTGAAIPGVVLDQCSPAFQKAFQAADLIIAKGQGNYETLDPSDPRIFFLFKAKCPVVAAHANVRLHDMVIRQGGQ